MKIFAHRGYSQKYPENTFMAFEKAIGLADYIELDVALTFDQKVVVIHDDLLDRTTNIKGAVAATNWSDIQKADAGSWKNAEFNQCRIPLLKDLLPQIAPRIPINIEIKASSVLLDPDKSIETFLQPILEGWVEKGQLLLSSFEPLALHRLRGVYSKAPLAYLTEKAANPYQRDEMLYLACQAHHMDIDQIKQSDVDWAHAQGLKIHAYTVNKESQWKKAKELSLDGVFTDDLQSKYR